MSNPSTDPKPKGPRATITTTVFLWGLVALALSFPVSASITWFAVNYHIERRAADEIEATAKEFDLHFLAEARRLASSGDWLTTLPQFGEAVRLRDTTSLTALLKPLIGVSGATTIAVLDPEGVALLEVQSDQSETAGTRMVPAASARDALAGEQLYLLEPDSLGNLRLLRVVPVYDGSQKTPIAVLALGVVLESNTLRSMAMRPNSELVLAVRSRIVASTHSSANGKGWIDQPAPVAAISAEHGNRQSELTPLATNTGVYRFGFYPLSTPDGMVLGTYGVGVSEASLSDARDALLRANAASLLASLIPVMFVALLLSRSLAAPIRRLSQQVGEMADGRLTTPIQSQRSDEIGDLTRRLDSIRLKWSEAMQGMTMEKERYASVLRSMAAAAVISDEHHQIVDANQAAEQLLLQDRDALLGQQWQQLFVATDRLEETTGSFWDLGATPADGRAAPVVRGRFPLRAQPQVVLDIISTQITNEGELSGYVHILQDVSVQEQFERAKDDYLLNVAHELRSPLAALQITVETLIEDYAVMSKHDFGVMLRTLRRSIVKFQGLIENLIDIGRLQAGVFRTQPVVTDFNGLVQDAINRIEPILQSRDQRIEMNLDCPDACFVLADRNRIIRVLLNLLTNASKYSDVGQTIGVATFRHEGAVFAEITDHGPGIAPDDQVKLFKRFYRAKKPEEEGAGLGIGLALAQGIIKAHGGQIGLRSQPGAGTTFWFSLRDSAATAPQPSTWQPPPEEKHEDSGS